MTSNPDSSLAAAAELRHVAIIMDGSGRWAAARGLPRSEGHRAGRAAVRRAVNAAVAHGIRVLTLFTFSTENWGRPEAEVCGLMRTFEDFFRTDAMAFAKLGIRVTAVGRRDRLPASLVEAIEAVEDCSDSAGSKTFSISLDPWGNSAQNNRASVPPRPHRRRGEADEGVRPGFVSLAAPRPSASRLHVRLAIDYSGQDAILRAARRFQAVEAGSAGDFARLLTEGEASGAPVPDVDLLIRTGGELRLSNCPLWEIAYAELYFTPCLWPDFAAVHLDDALREFSTRQRRFGRIPALAY